MRRFKEKRIISTLFWFFRIHTLIWHAAGTFLHRVLIFCDWSRYFGKWGRINRVIPALKITVHSLYSILLNIPIISCFPLHIWKNWIFFFLKQQPLAFQTTLYWSLQSINSLKDRARFSMTEIMCVFFRQTALLRWKCVRKSARLQSSLWVLEYFMEMWEGCKSEIWPR